MQVQIQPATGSPVILADDTGQQVCLDDQRFRFFGEVQTAKYTRGPSQKTFYRSNEGVEYSFTVVRQFDDIASAENFMLRHRRDTPKAGTILLVSGSSGGSNSIPNATIVDMDIHNIGRSVFVRYTVIGGGIS